MHVPKRTVSSAPGKVILLGEHAVVYGTPAIAAPLCGVRAVATVTDAEPGSGVCIVAPDLDGRCSLTERPTTDDLAALQTTVRNTLHHVTGRSDQDLCVTVRSEIPIARGLGSGTAVATALVRAVSAHVGGALEAEEVSDLVLETERLLHGTPSGIDNTVVAHERAVFFVKGREPAFLDAGEPVHLVIADTGLPSRTRDAVLGVQHRWQLARSEYEAVFHDIGALVERARDALGAGDVAELGRLMDANHALLRRLEVSSPELDRLVEAARAAGALGAKLTGGGRGGAMIALAPDGGDALVGALQRAGAAGVLGTTVPGCA